MHDASNRGAECIDHEKPRTAWCLIACVAGRVGVSCRAQWRGEDHHVQAIMGFEAIGGGQILWRGKALNKLATHRIAAAGLGYAGG
jgi:ABC-type branched-subunit amino acid transport system ATPase component